MDISTIIRNARLNKGLTMRDVAKHVGVSEAAVSKWESGQISSIKNEKLPLLAEILGIPILDLIMTDEQRAVRDYNIGMTGSHNKKIGEIMSLCSGLSDDQLDRIIQMIKIII